MSDYKTYQDYVFEQHYSKLKQDSYYIKKIPADEVNYEICRIALTGAAGDCELFKWVLKHFPQFIDEKLCKIAVDAEPKKKFIRSVEAMEDPDGRVYYDDEYKYFDPVIKYVPEQFKTPDVCRASQKHDWRTFEFVSPEMQLSCPDICEKAVKNFDEIMTDDIEGSRGREKKIFDILNKSVFEQHPNILGSEYTLKYVSTEWTMANPDQVCRILQKHPDQIKRLSKEFRTQHFDFIRQVAEKKPEILMYLTAPEQKKLIDLCEKALKNGNLTLHEIPASVQMMMPKTCVTKLTRDPHERLWLCKSWAHKPNPGLNLAGLCTELQSQNPELISKLVSETPQLLEYVKPAVLIAHPEICRAAMAKRYEELTFSMIPKAVFKKHPELYRQLLEDCPGLLQIFPKEVQTRENWTFVIEKAPWMLRYAPKEYTTIEQYKIAFADKKVDFLSMVPKKFRTYEICKLAVINYAPNIEDVPDNIKEQHPDICDIAVEKNPYCIKDVPESVQLQNPNICKLAVSSNPKTIEKIPASVQRQYPEICRLAMAQTLHNWYPCFTRSFRERIEEDKKKVYSAIPKDVLKKHWDYINDAKGVIVAIPNWKTR